MWQPFWEKRTRKNKYKTGMGESFAPGLRFYPTEEELVSFYLLHKLEGKREERLHRVIPVIDICSMEPWELPKLAGELCQGDTEQWFFFTPRQEREASGGKPSRTTASGYWKATGSPGYVYSSNNRVIGVKKTMVFYKGKAPNGRKTKWKMNEYRAIEVAAHHSSTTCVPKLRHEFSLCRVYVISGSFRAFDRRPFEAMATETPLAADKATATASSQRYAETSNEAGYHSDAPAATPSWVTVDGFANPWEQLNWL